MRVQFKEFLSERDLKDLIITYIYCLLLILKREKREIYLDSYSECVYEDVKMLACFLVNLALLHV